MRLKLHSKKWFWTSNKDITSAFFEFDYSDIKKINALPELFKIDIWWFVTNASINNWSQTPIVIETEIWVSRFKEWEASFDLINPYLCMIKLDIYINDQVCWMIRIEELNIVENV
jgi:uncharacterized protein YjdB